MPASAESLNALGTELKEEGRFAEAERAYLRATELDPAWAAPWFNLGLLCKLQRRWADSLRYNRRAVELDPEDGDGWWNLGIAASALGEWPLARRAWRGCGIEVPDGEGAPALRLGPVPVRLDAGGTAEVVWCERLDPARAVIRNVPLPGSGYHEGDTVLHDGAPNGYRVLNGRQVPVFDALERLESSGRATVEAWVEAASAAEVEALEAAAAEAGMAAEDWSETVREICRECSEGVPHEEHRPAPAPWSPRRHLGLSAPSAAGVRRLLESWARGGPGRSVLEVRAEAGG